LQASDNYSELSSKIVYLEGLLEKQQQKEKQLMTDMKKKGDLARQLISSKDAEISKLRDRLQGTIPEDTSVQDTTFHGPVVSMSPPSSSNQSSVASKGDHEVNQGVKDFPIHFLKKTN